MSSFRPFRKFSRWFAANRFTGILAIVAVLVFGGVFAFIAVKRAMFGAGMALYLPPPVSVAVADARSETWQDELPAVGTIEADRGVDVAAEVGGTVRGIEFRSGQQVKEGEVLVQLDDSIEQAELKSLDAQLDLARINSERDKRLLTSRSISKTEYDTGQARLKDLEAKRERTHLVIEQKHVQAPFAGRLGIRRVSIGQYLVPGEKLVALQALDELHMDFMLPEQFVPQLKTGSEVRFKVRAYGDREFIGKIAALDSRVDTNTRNVRVRAVLDNPGNILVPGMFADMRVLLPQKNERVVVPSTAVTPSLYGDSVYVLKAEAGKHEGLLREATASDGAVANIVAGLAKKAPVDKENPMLGKPVWIVDRRMVELGERRANNVAILKGVESGEKVIVAGTLKLKQGSRVIIDNTVAVIAQ